MPLYHYRKQSFSPKKKAINYFSYISLTAGSLLLFWSIYPILSFQIYSKLVIGSSLRSPVPQSGVVSSLQEANAVLGSSTIFSNNLRDFTQASLWFPTKPQDSTVISQSNVKEYYLSIPKLNINNAKVTVGGEDLTKSLVHYLPQSMPGETGKVSIFGHSTLPSLYNVKDYKTIFTYLPSLEKGDKIFVKVQDVTYQYEVTSMYVVKPEQISVLEQKTDGSYLTLVTCVPPGTFWERLVVESKLTELPVQNN